MLPAGTASLLVFGLVVTALVVAEITRRIEQESHARFVQLTDRLVGEVHRRVTQPRYGMAGARGVFAASKSVERSEFAEYVASRDLDHEFPGAIGFGFIQRVMRTDLDAFIAAERADGAPDFAVRSLATPGSPLEHAPDLYVVKHCFPIERNALAWGIDVGSEPVRREAAERASLTGEPAISGRITLVQAEEAHAGFLYFVPGYDKGTNPTTPEQRLAALTGLVYAPIILEEALAGVADWVNGELHFEIFQGTVRTSDALLFDYHQHFDATQSAMDSPRYAGHMLVQATPLSIGGQTWTIVTTTTPTFHAGIDQSTPQFIGVGGTLLSVLLAGIVWTLGSGRARAMSLAKGITADLAAAKAAADRLADIARRTSNAVVITDPHGLVEWVNEGFTRITGYTLEEVKGRKPGHVLQGPDTDKAEAAKLGQAVVLGSSATAELINYTKDGRSYWVAMDVTPLRDDSGAITGFMAIETDITAQKAASEALRVERERLEMAADSARMGLWDWNPQTGVVQFDQRWADMIGYRLDELKPHVSEWTDRVHPDDLERALKTVNDAMVNDTAYSCEHRFRHRDGSWIWILDQGRIVTRDQDGKVTRFVGSHLDITQRKRSELELARATAMLERTGELAQVGGWSVDLDTMKLSWTLQTFRIAEIEPPNEPDLERGINLFAPEARPVVAAAVQAAIDSGTPYDLEVPLITAKGRHRWVKTQGYAEMRNGKAVRIYGTFQDISDRRLAELELKKVNERFLLATRAGGVGTWDYNIPDNLLCWDDQMFRLYGIPREKFDGAYEAWRAGVHPDDRARLDLEIQQAIRGDKEFDTEFRVVWPDGTIRHIRGIAEVQRDPAGRAIRLVGTNWDVTEKKLAEERLRSANVGLDQARQAADAANRAKSAFLANMSHEIRTPLTAILGFTDLLREDGNILEAPERRLQTIDTIKNAGQHLLTVINDILDLSKIEADKMTVERIDTPLLAVLHEVESLMRPHAATKGLSFRVELNSPVPERITSDPTRLRQILLNLAGNAVKFTESGGITISVNASTSGHSPTLAIDFQDTGAGMTDEQASRLFHAFGQADDTVTRKFGGTGLGLTICRRLALLMGGDVTLLHTRLGVGSCFRLLLPLQAVPGSALVHRWEAVTTLGTLRNTPAPSTLRGRILLAEDGPDNQRLIQFHLRNAGATVEVADNGRIALEMLDNALAEGSPFDLLLTDMQMPEIDGYTLARTLRARGSTMPIVALTAHAMADDRKACIDAGCDEYATKPIDKNHLLNVCTQVLTKTARNADVRPAA